MGAGCDGQIMRQEMLSVPNPIDLRPALEGPMAPSARPMRPSVIVVGSINVDFVVRVVRLPRPGETVSGGSYERHGGGKGANAAVAAARSAKRSMMLPKNWEARSLSIKSSSLAARPACRSSSNSWKKK